MNRFRTTLIAATAGLAGVGVHRGIEQLIVRL
jgi:hypothetical protein